MNRPTETGVGVDMRNVPEKIRERMRRQRADAEARANIYRAFCDAAVRAYEATKEGKP